MDAPGRGHIFERLERSVHSLTRLIDDLLDVSSIVTGKMRLNLQPLDLRQPIETALDSVRAAATAKGIELQLVVDPRTPPIVGDRDRLQQVIWNLLSNAVKFTPDGGRVTVRLAHDSARIAIEVTDSGRGITPEFMPRLFERFTQAAQGPRRAVPGLGLGLAIVRHLVELHGGTIRPEPGEGQGSTFSVSLPVATLAPEALTPREHELVFRECGNHPVATCSSCGKSYRLWQLRADSMPASPTRARDVAPTSPHRSASTCCPARPRSSSGRRPCGPEPTKAPTPRDGSRSGRGEIGRSFPLSRAGSGRELLVTE